MPEQEFQLTLTQLLHPASCSYFGKIPWTLKPTSSTSSSEYSSAIRTQNTTVSNYSTIWQNAARKSHHQQQQKQGSHKLVNLLILHLLLRGQSPSTSKLLGSQMERSGRATEETLTQRDSQTQQNWSPTALGSEEKNPQLHRSIGMWSWRDMTTMTSPVVSSSHWCAAQITHKGSLESERLLYYWPSTLSAKSSLRTPL